MTPAPMNPVRHQAARNNAHYRTIFSRFKANLGDDSLRFETDCLAYELSQIPGMPESALVLNPGCGTGRYAAA